MTFVEALGLLIVTVSAGGIALVFALYPLALAVRAWASPRPVRLTDAQAGEPPSVTVIVVARNAEALIEAKVRNTLAVDYPSARLEIVLCSDGSTDATFEIMSRFAGERVRCIRSVDHVGKAEMLNRGVRAASENLLVFTDVDALLPAEALSRLMAPFADPDVGGVCGARRIREDDRCLGRSQETYCGFDGLIKRLESRTGSLSSNDGKLYAMRREFFRPVPPDVTDDLYACLGVLAARARFVFEPRATARVPAPARSVHHEVSRRRRIVSRSLRGIWLDRRILVPWRYPEAAMRIGINKVCRRLLPSGMVGLLAGSALLVHWHSGFVILAAVQAGFYGVGLAGPAMQRLGLHWLADSVCAIPMYILAGASGTALGWLDFLRGRSVQRWEPQKGGEPAAIQLGLKGVGA